MHAELQAKSHCVQRKIFALGTNPKASSLGAGFPPATARLELSSPIEEGQQPDVTREPFMGRGLRRREGRIATGFNFRKFNNIGFLFATHLSRNATRAGIAALRKRPDETKSIQGGTLQCALVRAF